ncbi:putative HEAT repeat-containing domain protein [Trichinella spiralis]|uniref:putative HEAT repeat-containing domain protein n=1 Tax=Trichinella spiralis TaxID=6334 RepID=UPI0001EFC928|nr:putative HEAT repeat-containing domain protein [Trichinella spiralis]
MYTYVCIFIVVPIAANVCAYCSAEQLRELALLAVDQIAIIKRRNRIKKRRTGTAHMLCLCVLEIFSFRLDVQHICVQIMMIIGEKNCTTLKADVTLDEIDWRTLQ